MGGVGDKYQVCSVPLQMDEKCRPLSSVDKQQWSRNREHYLSLEVLVRTAPQTAPRTCTMVMEDQYCVQTGHEIPKRCSTLEYSGELELSTPFMDQWTLDARRVLTPYNFI